MPRQRVMTTNLEYRKPQIVDHGTLAELTAAFDVSVFGSAAKLVTMAAVSMPVAGLIETAGTQAAAPRGSTAGQVLSPDSATAPASAAGPGSAGATRGAGGGGGGGGLPFTGYPAAMAAGLGAILSLVGYALRAKLRRLF
jgi:hypothetical protein